MLKNICMFHYCNIFNKIDVCFQCVIADNSGDILTIVKGLKKYADNKKFVPFSRQNKSGNFQYWVVVRLHQNY